MKVVWLTVKKYREDGFNKIDMRLNDDWESCAKMMSDLRYVTTCLKKGTFCINVAPYAGGDMHVSMVTREADVNQIVRLKRIDSDEIYDEHIANVIPLSDLLGHTLLDMIDVSAKSPTMKKHYAIASSKLNSLSEFFHSRIIELRQ